MEINVASPRYYATTRRGYVKVGRVENGGGGGEATGDTGVGDYVEILYLHCRLL